MFAQQFVLVCALLFLPSSSACTALILTSLVSTATSAGGDCGDIESENVDHHAEAGRYQEEGNWQCVLAHRSKDSEMYGDIDSFYNLAVACAYI
jgi:hypothetical protein